jgi:AcrR family transcriptional regulator
MSKAGVRAREAGAGARTAGAKAGKTGERRARDRRHRGPGGRSSAEERREEILAAAIQEFAKFGLYGTSVDAIAERVGISQPYIFRLFGTKKELFIAAALQVCGRIQQAFGDAGKASPNRPLEAMGHAYGGLLSSRAELLVLLHAFAASEDPEVKAVVSARYEELWDFVAKTSGATRIEVRGFFADGMGMTVGAALGLSRLFAPVAEEPDCD